MSTPSRYAVFGHPITHSQSPRIHQWFAAQFNISVCYASIDAAPKDFPDAVQRFFTDEKGRGANVTLPHKAAAFDLADMHSQAATRVGTANVLTRLKNGQLEADNTDGTGLIRDLTERHHIMLDNRHVLLLGAGGAARGIAWSLLEAGIATLTIVNRTAARAEALVNAINNPARVRHQSWQQLTTLHTMDLIINATSAGVLHQFLDLPTTLTGADTVCYDLAYGPAADAFLDWARAAGTHRVHDGLGMLLETAADTFERWHGRRPVTGPVYQALQTASVRP